MRHNEHGDLRAVLARVKDLLHLKEGGVKVRNRGGPEHLGGGLLLGKVVGEDHSRLNKGRELQEHLRVLLPTGEARDGADRDADLVKESRSLKLVNSHFVLQRVRRGE